LQTWVNWVYFYDKDNGIAVGDPDSNLNFEIYKTSDGGTTWTQVPAGSIPIAYDQEVGSPADFAVSGDNIWFTTDFGRVYHSKDKGLSWEVFDFNLQLSEFLWGIVVDQNNNLYMTTNDITGIFRIYKRTPFASNWVEITPLNNMERVTGLCNIPSSDFLILNSYTNFDDDNTFSTRLSLDQGKTWKEISRGDRAGFVNFSSNKVGYSSQVPKSYSEPSKVAFRYKGPIISMLKDLVQNNLTIELSPNPVSDMATISWKSELNSAVNIDIVNAEGKLITSEKIAFNNNQSITKNLAGLTKGQYSLIISDKNKILGVKEFIKK
ncbi:MAG: T9SS type A sorting domain-containing protein, partial [Saprospiraceae bacterium]